MSTLQLLFVERMPNAIRTVLSAVFSLNRTTRNPTGERWLVGHWSMGIVLALFIFWGVALTASDIRTPEADDAVAVGCGETRNGSTQSTGCGNTQGLANPDKPDGEVTYEHAVVAADHMSASHAGVVILKAGGNVVDAAVATSLALSVVRPASSGIGGGGFLMYWDAKEQQAYVYDYRERAPNRATRDLFIGPKPAEGEPSSVHGSLAVAVPGEVAGLCVLHAQHGRLPLSKVVQPAIDLAREGVVIDEHDREIQREVLSDFKKFPSYRKRFGALERLYLNKSEPWKPGDRFYSPLAAVLERIARDGAAGFHEGDVADAIINELTRSGGIMTHDDLKSQRPVIRKPIRGERNGKTWLTMPPPSSGGTVMLQSLNTLDVLENRYQIKPSLKDLSWLHLLVESTQHAFADRAMLMGDTDFVSVPIEQLTSAKYAKQIADKIDPTKTFPADHYGKHEPATDSGTSHFSILDREGNAVACTETINTLFGSYVVEPTFGIVLNNEMDDFTARPGEPNAFGLQQSAANAIEPKKKPLSSMSPTIIVSEGKAQWVAGASGGPRIITATLQTLLRMEQFGQSPGDAIQSPRWHHQWMPHRLEIEKGFSEELIEAMGRIGHTTQTATDGAVVQAARRTKSGVQGASDHRKRGQAAGY